MFVVLQLLLAVVLCLLLLWVWRLQGGSRRGLALAAAVLVAFFLPWALRADWALVGRVGLGFAVAAALVLGYAWLLGRIRAAARRRDGDR